MYIFFILGKHGVWRIQENGLIREYRKKGKIGLTKSIDVNSASINFNHRDIIKQNYAHYIPEEGRAGYKYPDERISDGKYDGLKNYLNFIDLNIYHPKYNGKYDHHVAIDLPYYYCIISADDFPHAQHVWKFAVAQPMANKIGPLGKRAVLDIRETHFNAVRMSFFEDAGIWANIGTGNSKTNKAIKNLEELKKSIQTLNYQRIDLNKYNYEVYFVERPFFNKPYINLAVVIDNIVGPSDFSYIRRDGAYWQGLLKHGDTTGLSNNSENHYPKYYIKSHLKQGSSIAKTIYGTPVYGVHHPDRPKFSLIGGACPQRGGDWGRYPWANSGSGFRNNYEKITPLCDALLVDVKMWGNLWQDAWNDEQFVLGNAGFPGKHVINFYVDPNLYGKYTDPYLKNKKNPHMMDLTKNGKVVQQSQPKPGPIVLKLNFTNLGYPLNYNEVSVTQNVSSTVCPALSECPTTEGKSFITAIFSSPLPVCINLK